MPRLYRSRPVQGQAATLLAVLPSSPPFWHPESQGPGPARRGARGGGEGMDSSSHPAGQRPGLIMAIGGAEDKVRERAVLRRFVEACGGPDASIVVLATASEHPETGDRYAELFHGMDADTVEVLRIRTREDAVEAGREVHGVLEYATGFFMTGGSQLRISSALGGTALAATLRRRHAEGM